MNKCYTTLYNRIITLENLTKEGYQLCDKVFITNDEQITLVFKTYAKFNAFSFAFQDAKEYRKMMAYIRTYFMFCQTTQNGKIIIQLQALKTQIFTSAKMHDNK